MIKNWTCLHLDLPSWSTETSMTVVCFHCYHQIDVHKINLNRHGWVSSDTEDEWLNKNWYTFTNLKKKKTEQKPSPFL